MSIAVFVQHEDLHRAHDNQTLTDLVQGLPDTEVSRILDEMPPDHVAEIVEKLPEEHAAKLRNLMKKERSEDVQELLECHEDTAGQLMSPNIVAVREHATVADAISGWRRQQRVSCPS